MEESEENDNLAGVDFLFNTRIVYGCAQLKQQPRTGRNRRLYPSRARRVVYVYGFLQISYVRALSVLLIKQTKPETHR